MARKLIKRKRKKIRTYDPPTHTLKMEYMDGSFPCHVYPMLGSVWMFYTSFFLGVLSLGLATLSDQVGMWT